MICIWKILISHMALFKFLPIALIYVGLPLLTYVETIVSSCVSLLETKKKSAVESYLGIFRTFHLLFAYHLRPAWRPIEWLSIIAIISPTVVQLYTPFSDRLALSRMFAMATTSFDQLAILLQHSPRNFSDDILTKMASNPKTPPTCPEWVLPAWGKRIWNVVR